jgi:hypothetical protein
MFEIEVEITWRMMQIRVSSTHYIGVPISSDGSVISMFRFTSINGINMLEFYLNSRSRQENTSLV